MKCDQDQSFGPLLPTSVPTECRSYDFTVYFEDAWLTLTPNAIILPFVLFRGLVLSKRASVVDWPLCRFTKKVSFFFLAAVLTAEIGLYAPGNGALLSDLTIPAYALALITTIGLAILSLLEHARSVCPSATIQIYLLFMGLFDIALVRTAWLVPEETTVASLRSVALGLKLVILWLESLPKDVHITKSRSQSLSPEDKAGFFSRSLLLWLNPLFLRGYREKLTGEDLYPVSEDLAASNVSEALSRHWETTASTHRRRLAWALSKAFKKQLFVIQLPRLALVGFSVAQPLLINKTLSYVIDSRALPPQIGYGLIGAFAATYIGVAISTVWYQHLIFRLMSMIRGSLVTAIYQHSLRLPMTESNDASGPISLINSDIERVTRTLQWVLNIFPNIVQVGLSLWILDIYMDAVCIAPLLVAIACGIASDRIGRLISPRQRAWMQAIQKRVKVTSNAISSMRNVKMTGLEVKLRDQIRDLRAEEMEKQKAYRRLQISLITLGNIPAMLTPAVTFTAYAVAQAVSSDAQVQTATAFTAISLLSIIINPVAELVTASTNLMSALGCLDRIQEFLQKGRRQDQRVLQAPSADTNDAVTSLDVSSGLSLQNLDENSSQASAGKKRHVPLVRAINADFGWEPLRPILRNINITINPSTITIITGPTGCGKSTLLRSLLGETILLAGLVECASPKQIAYCHSDPWIMNISIKKNIMGISDWDENRYQTVIEACQLRADFEQLPDGDETLAGSSGSALSGGQKQRISLARAAYSGKQLTIMDDTMSGLDPGTAVRCFQSLLGETGLLRQDGRTVLFATHNSQWFPYVDEIIVMSSEGQITSKGTFAELSATSDYFKENAKAQTHSEESSQPGGRTATIHTPVQIEKTNVSTGHALKTPREATVLQQNEIPQGFPTSVFRYYLSTIGKKTIWLFFALVIVHIGCSTAQPIWLKFWAASNDEDPNANFGRWTSVYVIFGLATVMGIMIETGYFMLICIPKSATSLHLAVLNATVRAPLSFFVGRDIGEIVNLFSADLTLVDMALPLSFILGSEKMATSVAQIILTCVSSGYLAVTIPILGLVLYFLQRLYLKTSRQLRILDLELKAPLIDHFMTTFNGLVTIRAFSWMNQAELENMRLLDMAQRPFYLIYCLQRWLSLVLDLATAGLATLLVGIAVAIKDRIDPGLLGVALVSVMTLGEVLGQLVLQWTNFETSLGAVSRVRSYADKTPSESKRREDVEYPIAENNQILLNWLSHGEVIFSNVSASYGDNLVLNGVDLRIEGGSKVAICGRTGSGKSTLFSLLLRLYEPSHGFISVDGVEVSTIDHHHLRASITVAPQDPFFITGSVRLNADPFNKYGDEDGPIWDAFKKTGLADLIDENGGLDAELDIEWFSSGQRQLFCLSRALLQKSRLVLLDEGTSQLDSETEKSVTDIILTELRESTVIMITHRLKTLINSDSWCDKIVVLQQGRIVEQGPPMALYNLENGVFRDMLGV